MVTFIRISEGITHLDDLPMSKFLEVLGRLKSMSFTEKLDGSNLWVGRDDQGKLYTSREGKRTKAERMYSPDQWNAVGGNNAFKAAHTALLKVEDKLKKTIGTDQGVNLEVLFGSQPNTVDYGDEGKNMIAVLSSIPGTPAEVAQAVSDALKGTDVDINVSLLASDDGERIKEVPTVTTFKFTTPKKLDAAKLEDQKFHEEVKKLTDFLAQKSSVGMTNLELAEINLQKVDKEKRADVKAAREELLTTLETEYKAPLKRLMLDLLLGNDKKKAEGVVATDENGEQVKIIDKDGFSAANKQAQAERATLMGPVMTIDPGASIESRGGVVGELKIKLADLLGNVDLARGAELKRVLRTLKGRSSVDTLKSFSSQFKPEDFQQIKSKAEALTDATIKHVAERLEKFKAASKTDLNGEGKLGPDVVKRTLLYYAEVRKNLKVLREKIGAASDIQHLINALYGGAIASIHQEDPKVNEGLLEHRGELDVKEYANKDAYTLLNCYLANTFMTMLIVHEQDKLGLKRIRDKKNYLLKHWASEMSPMNFWGSVIWRSTRKDIKAQLSPKVEKELKAMTKHVHPSWWKYLHMDFSFDGSVTIDWADHHRTLKRLIDSSGYRTPRVNTLLKGMFEYPTLAHDDKVKLLNQLYMLCMQFVPTSYLFKRMRAIQSNMLLNANGENYQMVAEGSLLKSFTQLAEDGESPAAVGAAFPTAGQPVTATATNSADIAPVEKRLGDNSERMIIRRKRNPNLTKLTRKFKDPRKNNGTLKDLS